MEEIQGKHQEAITDRDNQIQAFEFTNEEHQQKMLGLNEEINDLIANRHVANCGCLATRCVLSKTAAEKFTHATLFDVSTGSLKNISDGLSFVTQTWRWSTNVMIQTSFTDGVSLTGKVKSVK